MSLSDVSAQRSNQAEFGRLRANYCGWWLANNGFDTSPTHLHTLLASQNPDGSWPDIDYADKSAADWKPSAHFQGCLHDLTAAYAASGFGMAGDAALLSAILRGLDFWLKHDFQSYNWWHNMIGVPAYNLGPVLLAMKDHLSPDQIAMGTMILDHCQLRVTKTNRHVGWRSGGNCIFDCLAAFNLAVFAEDEDLLQAIYSEQLFKYAAITPHDVPPEPLHSPASGVKEDYSHWEHGNLLFNHGYGALLAEGLSRLVLWARGTPLPISRNGLAFVTCYLLDGCQWMARGDWLSYDAFGREIARRAQADSKGRFEGTYLTRAARNLLEFGVESRRAELEALISRASPGNENPLVGNRMFYISDYMTHHRPVYFASARMYSTRTIGTEECNGENLRGHHLADGASYLVRRGDEYAGDVVALWDWHRIPGATISRGEFSETGDLHSAPADAAFPGYEATPIGDAPPDAVMLTLKRWGRTDFVGGVSDGLYGAACFDLAVLSLQARKSWFFFDDAYVCLGAGITDPADSDVFTTVNQCRLVGDVVIFENEDFTALNGRREPAGPVTVWHDDVAYVFPEDTRLVCENTLKTANWKAINASIDAEVSGRLFLLGIDHGRSPKNDSYVYRVYPGIGREEAAEIAVEQSADRRLQYD